MKKFYLTFGCGHPLGDNWIEIEAENFEEARKLAFETFGRNWGSVYEQENWNSSYFPGGRIGKTLKKDVQD